MTNINRAIEALKENGIEAFDVSGILTVPCDTPDDIVYMVSKVKHVLKRIDYQKSWLVDPYYWQKNRKPDGSVDIDTDEFA